MSNELQVSSINQGEVVSFVKDQIMRGASDSELQAFMMVARATGLDPMRRQIFAVKRAVRQKDGSYKDQWTTQCSIDGFRSIADAAGDYEGQSGPFWCGADGAWRDVWLESTPPMAAKVGVIRRGFREPLYRVATWSEYAQLGKDNKPTKFWANMPSLMLAKCAEALALRAAFPQKLGGVYISDEMAQAEQEVVSEPVKQEAPRHYSHGSAMTPKPVTLAPPIEKAPDATPELNKLIQRAMEGGPIGARNYAEAIGWPNGKPYPNCMTFQLSIGKNKGKMLLDIDEKDLRNLAEYFIREHRDGKTLSPAAVDTVGAIQDYIDSRMTSPPLPSEHDMPQFSDDLPSGIQS